MLLLLILVLLSPAHYGEITCKSDEQCRLPCPYPEHGACVNGACECKPCDYSKTPEECLGTVSHVATENYGTQNNDESMRRLLATESPTKAPTTPKPSVAPSTGPTDAPSPFPTLRPTAQPSTTPTRAPTTFPTTLSPSMSPTDFPTLPTYLHEYTLTIWYQNVTFPPEASVNEESPIEYLKFRETWPQFVDQQLLACNKKNGAVASVKDVEHIPESEGCNSKHCYRVKYTMVFTDNKEYDKVLQSIGNRRDFMTKVEDSSRDLLGDYVKVFDVSTENIQDDVEEEHDQWIVALIILLIFLVTTIISVLIMHYIRQRLKRNYDGGLSEKLTDGRQSRTNSRNSRNSKGSSAPPVNKQISASYTSSGKRKRRRPSGHPSVPRVNYQPSRSSNDIRSHHSGSIVDYDDTMPR